MDNEIKMQNQHSFSNSVRNGQNLGIGSKNILVSIDNITFTGQIGGRVELSFFNNLSINPAIEIHQSATSFVKGQAYNKALYYQYDKFNPSSLGNNIRVEFNPNNMADCYEDYISTFLQYISNISITRIDIAFDIKEDLSNYEFEIARTQKGIIYHDSNYKIESRYWGTRYSSRYVRLYDKKKQLKLNEDNEEWHRLEFQLKNNWINNWSNCLDGLTLSSKPFVPGLEGIKKAVITGLLTDPSIWDELSKNTKTEYKRLMAELTQCNYVPALKQALLDNHDSVADCIHKWTYLDADTTLNYNQTLINHNYDLSKIAKNSTKRLAVINKTMSIINKV